MEKKINPCNVCGGNDFYIEAFLTIIPKWHVLCKNCELHVDLDVRELKEYYGGSQLEMYFY
jgi:hypothetical protein